MSHVVRLGLVPVRRDCRIFRGLHGGRNQWLAELLSGRSKTLDEMGRRDRVSKRYVSRIIRLAFLAPSIIEEIARGDQPPELTVQALSTRRGDLPLRWRAQREILGFDTPARIQYDPPVLAWRLPLVRQARPARALGPKPRPPGGLKADGRPLDLGPIDLLERVAGAPVSLIATRFHFRSIIDRRAW
jgi:hypothetical protein